MNREADPVYERARAAKEAHEAELLRKANVVGVGVGLRQRGGARTDVIAVIVLVRQKVPRARLAPQDLIPVELDGVPVDVQQIGEIRKQQPATRNP